MRSLDRYIKYSNGRTQLARGKILNCFLKGNGYISVDLYLNKKKRKYYVHRLVAETFISNPENKPTVNHLDEDRSNNCVTNLEWATYEENLNYGSHPEKMSKAMTNNPLISRRVVQMTLDLEIIKEYPSATEAGRQLGIPATSIIRNCRGEKTKTCHGFVWKYAEDVKEVA